MQLKTKVNIWIVVHPFSCMYFAYVYGTCLKKVWNTIQASSQALAHKALKHLINAKKCY